ncbi:MAG: segregation and condensation protein A [Nitrospina sp.]|nr:MAG: segregation and condensation protein A [Nitrospina sp.]
MTYQLKLDIFEGPLDLLLHLIKEQKIDIYDIPLVDVTRQYLEYIEMMEDMNLELAGDYLVMAAELARIKSKELLPAPPGEEGGEEGEDPRAELTRRLLEYQRYKSVASKLREREIDRQQIFSRGQEMFLEDDQEEDLVDTSVFDLFSAFKKVLEQKSFRKDYEIKITTLSVSERIERVLNVLNERDSMTFEALFEDSHTQPEVIATFLALLELMRMNLVRVQQIDPYQTIRIYLTSDRASQQEAMKIFQDTESEMDIS